MTLGLDMYDLSSLFKHEPSLTLAYLTSLFYNLMAFLRGMRTGYNDYVKAGLLSYTDSQNDVVFIMLKLVYSVTQTR